MRRKKSKIMDKSEEKKKVGTDKSAEDVLANDAEKNLSNNDTPEAKVEKLENDMREMNDKFLRLYSEFDNFKRRTNKEKSDLIKWGGEDILKALLPVFDDFDRAVQVISNGNQPESATDGIILIFNKLKNTLSQKGLIEMKDSVGKELDTDYHEAISEAPAPDPSLSGKIIAVVEKGYILNEKVIRYAKVVVGK